MPVVATGACCADGAASPPLDLFEASGGGSDARGSPSDHFLVASTPVFAERRLRPAVGSREQGPAVAGADFHRASAREHALLPGCQEPAVIEDAVHARPDPRGARRPDRDRHAGRLAGAVGARCRGGRGFRGTRRRNQLGGDGGRGQPGAGDRSGPRTRPHAEQPRGGPAEHEDGERHRGEARPFPTPPSDRRGCGDGVCHVLPRERRMVNGYALRAVIESRGGAGGSDSPGVRPAFGRCTRPATRPYECGDCGGPWSRRRCRIRTRSSRPRPSALLRAARCRPGGSQFRLQPGDLRP